MIFCWVVCDLNMMLMIMMITVDVHQKCEHLGLGLGLESHVLDLVLPVLVLTTSLNSGSIVRPHSANCTCPQWEPWVFPHPARQLRQCSAIAPVVSCSHTGHEWVTNCCPIWSSWSLTVTKTVNVSGFLLYISIRLSYQLYHFFDTIQHWTLHPSFIYITTVWYIFQMFCIKQQVPTIVMILSIQYNCKTLMYIWPVLEVKT